MTTTATLTMVRTVCCEAHKHFGERCSICPNRPENRAAVLKFQAECRMGFGRKVHCPEGEDCSMCESESVAASPVEFQGIDSESISPQR